MRLTKMLKNQKGFSLIELMIVVAIIGVLATMAVPKFKVFQARAKRSEANSTLHHLYTLQEAYQLNFNTYINHANYGATNGAAINCAGNAGTMALGFSINPCVATTPRYGYVTAMATTAVFLTTATTGQGVNNKILPGCATADALQINQMNQLTQVAMADSIVACIDAI